MWYLLGTLGVLRSPLCPEAQPRPLIPVLSLCQYVRWRKKDSHRNIVAKTSLQELSLSPVSPTALSTVLSLAACDRTEVAVWVGGWCPEPGEGGVGFVGLKGG